MIISQLQISPRELFTTWRYIHGFDQQYCKPCRQKRQPNHILLHRHYPCNDYKMSSPFITAVQCNNTPFIDAALDLLIDDLLKQ